MGGERLEYEVIKARRSAWRRLRQLPWGPLLIIGGMVFTGVFAPLLTSYSPIKLSLSDRLQPPNREHILGTDTMGRDVLARLLFGARTTLIIAMITLIAGGGIGLVIGIVAGYFGGKIDAVISRLIDTILAFPVIFFALLFAVTLGCGLGTVVISISLVLWARFARVIRGEVLPIKEQDFVAQAIINGCSQLRIIVVDILPYTLNTFMVILSLNIGYIIVVEATLSFLGAGIPPPTPSWGSMVSEGRNFITSAWWLCVLPGTAITLVVLAFNLLGDWLRDFLDPKLREQL